MKAILKVCVAASSLVFAGSAFAKDALFIDKNGIVNIAGKLAVGTIKTNNIQAGNLDGTLKTLLSEIKALKSDVARLSSKLVEDDQWFVYAKTPYAAFAKISRSDRDLKNYEFAIFRNRGFRQAKFSSWNRGMRLMTEAYMTGDDTSSGPSPFRLGGSMWFDKNVRPQEFVGVEVVPGSAPLKTRKIYDFKKAKICPAGKVFHFYYKYSKDGVETVTGNRCQTESSVYARKRRFK